MGAQISKTATKNSVQKPPKIRLIANIYLSKLISLATITVSII